jgi:hypothetical protein
MLGLRSCLQEVNVRGSGGASGWVAEAAAVAQAQLEFSCWGWLFATWAVDYGGIDAQVEAVDGRLMSGRRVSLVIKTGGARFSDPVPEGQESDSAPNRSPPGP